MLKLKSLNKKSNEILDGVIRNDLSLLHPSIQLVSEAFRLFSTGGDIPTSEAGRKTPESQLIDMFRIIYTYALPFRLEFIPLVTAIYAYHIRKYLWRLPNKAVTEESVYAKVIGKNVFNSARSVFEEVCSKLKIPNNKFTLDRKRGLVLSMSAGEILRHKYPTSSSVILPDIYYMNEFNYKLAARDRGFVTASDGVLYPDYSGDIEAGEDL